MQHKLFCTVAQTIVDVSVFAVWLVCLFYLTIALILLGCCRRQTSQESNFRHRHLRVYNLPASRHFCSLVRPVPFLPSHASITPCACMPLHPFATDLNPGVPKFRATPASLTLSCNSRGCSMLRNFVYVPLS